MSETKEKILFETKDMVQNLNALIYSLQTQVAVLVATQTELVKKIDGHMERSTQQYDRMDVRVTTMGTDITTMGERINRHRDEIDDLKKKSNLVDFINFLIAGLGSAIAIWLGRQP